MPTNAEIQAGVEALRKGMERYAEGQADYRELAKRVLEAAESERIEAQLVASVAGDGN
jgi:hypothetical protein